MEPFFSIVIPVYNVESYIEHCIGDIHGQTFEDYEVILVDDGSTDNSGSICELYAKNDSRYKVVHQHNSGSSAARNTGLKEAKGKWIVYIDSDDRIETKSFLCDIYEQVINNNCDVVTYGYKRVRCSDNKIVHRYYEDIGEINRFLEETEKVKWAVAHDCFPVSQSLHACSRLFLLNNSLFFDESMSTAEDIEWFFRLMVYCPRTRAISATPYLYMIRENSHTTKRKKTGFWEYREKAITMSADRIKNTEICDDYKEALLSGLAYHYYVHLAELDYEPDPMIKEEAFRRAETIKWLKKYKGDRKTNACRLLISIFGVRKGAHILHYYLESRNQKNNVEV